MSARSSAVRRTTTALVLLVLLLVTAGCAPVGGGRITLTAMLSDASGLFVGNDVGILGVPVGSVTAIEPRGTAVAVTLEVDADQRIPADAGAVVVARSVATDRYVELTPVYHSGPTMSDGAVIDMDRTRTPVDFDAVLASLNELATGLAGQGPTAGAVGRAIDSGARALSGKGATANRALRALSEAVDGISARRGDIAATLTSLDALTGTLAKNQRTVRTFIDQVDGAGRLLVAERKDFRAAMDDLRAAVRLVARFAEENRTRMTTTLERSTALMESLLTRRADVTEVLRTMPLALQNLQRAGHGKDALEVRLDFTLLTAIAPLLEGVCAAAPLTDHACQLISPRVLNLQRLLDEVVGGGLLGALGGTR